MNIKRFKIAGLLIIYIALFLTIYRYQVVPFFEYAGFSYQISSNARFVTMIIFAWLPAVFLPTHCDRPSVFAIWILYLLVYVPACLVPFLSGTFTFYENLSHVNFLLLSLSVLMSTQYLPKISFGHISIQQITLLPLLWLIIGALILTLFIKFRHILRFSLLGSIYQQRDLFAETIQLRGLTSYFTHWLSGIIFPCCIAYGMAYRHYRWLTCGIVGQIFIYMIAAFKTVFVSIFFIIGLACFFRQQKRTKQLIVVFLSYFLIFLSACIVIDWLTNQLFLTHYFFRRMIAIPGLLTGWYWQYFLEHDYDYLAHSVFRFFSDNPHEYSIPYRVAYYFEGRYHSANANFWASAYANFGVLGMMAYSVLLSIYLWLYDSLTQNSRTEFSYPIIIWCTIRLSNSDLLTSFLTGGLLLLLFIIYLNRAYLYEKAH